MKVGTLVRWAVFDSDDYNCLGVIIKEEDDFFTVHWTDGMTTRYDKLDNHWKQVVALCE